MLALVLVWCWLWFCLFFCAKNMTSTLGQDGSTFAKLAQEIEWKRREA
jgi:hypothetical protein